ncbi:MAG: hypothetical protein MUF29_10515 [Chitinophagaceae bacterium]|jgi:hypothetical protein|nr:hypothetical protein [Chitinophagaceae bacterium]
MKKDQFIPGIYNYCDRWCERCAFTSRCRTYEGTSDLSPEQRDINNQAFWDNLSSQFAEALELLHKAAAERGIDLNALATEESKAEFEEHSAWLKDETDKHPLAQLSRQYRKMVHPFLRESLQSLLERRATDLESAVNLGIGEESDALATIAALNDAAEVIQWYLYFLDAKFRRALQGLLDGEEMAEEYGFPKDSEGSAKIAIIGVERSMAAWSTLHEQLPAAEDMALQALALLSRMRQEALAAFPHAMAFHRPGFDD